MKMSVFFDHILQAQEQTGKALEELLKGVRTSGVEAVEIRLEYMQNNKDIVYKLKQADLAVSCIYEFYDMGCHDERKKAQMHIAAAVQVGAKRVLVVPGFLHGFESKQMQYKMRNPRAIEAFLQGNKKIRCMVEGLSYIAKLGAKEGVVVTVEDFDDPNSPLSGMYGIRWFLEQIPELQYTLDTGNYLFYEEKVLEAWELLKDRVVHVHCKDRLESDNASTTVGTGYIPFEEIWKRLKAQEYEGYLAIEHFDVADQEECMRHSAENLLKISRNF